MPILVWPRSACLDFFTTAIRPWCAEQVMPAPVWRERSTVEDDPQWQQPIPYVVLLRAGQVWAYRRRGGDGRLDGRASVGVGGHVETIDAAHHRDAPAAATTLAILLAAAHREVAEELAETPQLVIQPRAWIHEHGSAIGQVHIGLVCSAEWPRTEPPQVRRGERLYGLGFCAPQSLPEHCEVWSHLAVQALQL